MLISPFTISQVSGSLNLAPLGEREQQVRDFTAFIQLHLSLPPPTHLRLYSGIDHKLEKLFKFQVALFGLHTFATKSIVYNCARIVFHYQFLLHLVVFKTVVLTIVRMTLLTVLTLLDKNFPSKWLSALLAQEICKNGCHLKFMYVIGSMLRTLRNNISRRFQRVLVSLFHMVQFPISQKVPRRQF